jgi:hypothetical protein
VWCRRVDVELRIADVDLRDALVRVLVSSARTNFTRRDDQVDARLRNGDLDDPPPTTPGSPRGTRERSEGLLEERDARVGETNRTSVLDPSRRLETTRKRCDSAT